MEDDSLKDSLFREKGLLRVAGLLKTEAFPGTERSLKKEGRVRSKRSFAQNWGFPQGEVFPLREGSPQGWGAPIGGGVAALSLSPELSGRLLTAFHCGLRQRPPVPAWSRGPHRFACPSRLPCLSPLPLSLSCLPPSLPCLAPPVPRRGRGPAPRSAPAGRAEVPDGAGRARAGVTAWGHRARLTAWAHQGHHRGHWGRAGVASRGPSEAIRGRQGRARPAGKRGAGAGLGPASASAAGWEGMGRDEMKRDGMTRGGKGSIPPPAAEGWAGLSWAGHTGNKRVTDPLSPAVLCLN